MSSPSALESIIKGPQTLPPRIILLGEEKIGKSTFASQFPDPIFITVQDETGLDELDTHSFPPADSYQKVLTNIGTLVNEDHSYKTLVLDSTSAFEKFLWDATLKRCGVKSFSDVPWGQGFKETRKEWERVTKGLDMLRDKKDMTCILIGHVSPTRRVDIEIGKEYDSVAWTVQKEGAGFLQRWADIILYAKRNITIDIKTGAFNKKIRTPRLLSDDRFLYCSPSPVRPGGGRGAYGLLPDEIPLSYKDFTIAVEKAQEEYQAVQQANKHQSPHEPKSKTNINSPTQPKPAGATK